ncbi:MAG: PorP/SprF family type IX secretion system membrane protein [Saprospiraceae bacterium]|nr:PorP/SprF family type IX secretion system membrane protein [Saprospiraceae bacterium]
MKNNGLCVSILLSLFLMVVCTEGVVAQQEGNMTLFMYNPWAINPAAAGYRDVPTLVVHHRSQWLGFKGAPVTQYLQINTPAFKSHRLGFSAGLTNRKAGYFESQTGNLALSYALVKTGRFAVRMGLQGSVRRFTTRFNTADDILVLQADRSIPPRKSARYFGNLGIGTFITLGESYLGFSVPFYLPTVIGINPYTPVSAAESAHYYLMGGLSFAVADGLTMKPQVLVKYVENAPWNVETNLSMVFKDKVTVGASYRAGKTNIVGVGESVSMTMLLQLSDRMALGGAYDWILSPIGQFSYGSFEATLRYDLKTKEVKLSNPRGF